MSASRTSMPPAALPGSNAYLLDTTHCSAVLKGDAAVQRKLRESPGASVRTSVISQGELWYMAENSQRVGENRESVRSFLQRYPPFPVDQATAETYGRIKATLRRYASKAGKRSKLRLASLGLTDNDLWIAAVAAQHGYTVVSGDSDFERIRDATGLPVENWCAT